MRLSKAIETDLSDLPSTESDFLQKYASRIHSETIATIQILGITKMVAGIVCILAIGGSAFSGLNIVYAGQLICFGAAGWFLRFGTHDDSRTTSLGIMYFLVADAFAEPLMTAAINKSLAVPLLRLLLNLTPEAFIPYFFARFVSHFPRQWSYRTGLSYRLTNVCLIAGILLFACSAAPIIWSIPDLPGYVRAFIEPDDTNLTFFWTTVVMLLLMSAAPAIYRTRRATTPERRRVHLFLLSIALGILPIFIAIILRTGPDRVLPALLAYSALLSIPITTSYAVVVRKVLDVRLIVRQALQYAFARYSIIALSILPFTALMAYVYQHRNESLVLLIEGGRVGFVVGSGLFVVAAYRFREPVLRVIDRRFFRDQYHSDRVLLHLVERVKLAAAPQDIGTMIAEQIDGALHLENVSFLVSDQARNEFRAPNNNVPPIPSHFSLLQLLQTNDYLEVDESRNGIFTELPTEEQQWIVEAKCRVLLGVLDGSRRPMAVISLGEKRSELPFSKTDLRLIKCLAAQCALTLEQMTMNPGLPFRTISLQPFERDEGTTCPECLNIYSADVTSCLSCEVLTRASALPPVLFGKLRIERQIGAGGMGIVYLAHDIPLNRKVALKTLPKSSPESILRMQREARAVAAVTHPNLATIYGAETWKGIPLLVFEYLSGGTLHDRIKKGDLSAAELLNIGIALYDALEHLHSSGILHRDIKPSNIGFTSQGIPKLLDFGLAKTVGIASAHHGDVLSVASSPSSAITVADGPSNIYLVGTPAYMSPEALNLETPDVYCDLWGLAVTLYEGIARRNPFQQSSVRSTLAKVATVAVPDIREFTPEIPSEVASFFKDALHRDKKRRPSSAHQIRRRLSGCISSLHGHALDYPPSSG